MYGEHKQWYRIMIKLANRPDLNFSKHNKEIMIMWHDSGDNYCYNGNHSIICKCIKSPCCTP